MEQDKKEMVEQPMTSSNPAEKDAKETKNAKSKTCLLVTILLLVLAIGGIAFGVYGTMLANQPHKCLAINNTTEENIIEVTCSDVLTVIIALMLNCKLALRLNQRRKAIRLIAA